MYNLLYKLNEKIWLKAIRMGFLRIQSIVIIGCLMTVIVNLPFNEYNHLMIRLIGEDWKIVLSSIQSYTLGIITIPLVLAVSYSLTSIICQNEYRYKLDPIIAAIVSFVNIIVLVSETSIVDISLFGVGGMALGILISLLSTEIFIFFYKVLNKDIKKAEYSNDGILNNSISSLIPAALTIILFFSIKVLLHNIGIEDVFALSNQILTSIILFLDQFIPTVFIYVVGIQIFWFFGIHGSNIFDIINTSFFEMNLEANRLAIENGIEATEIFTKQFFDIFVSIGGSGATVSLVIAIIIIKTNNNNNNSIAKLAILPAIFNINEIIVYGIPIIFNPAYIIPFILTPLVFTFTSYFSMRLGLVPVTINEVNWITPIFLNAYLATGSIQAILLQALNIVLGVLIYIPFVKLSNRVNVNQSKGVFEKLKKEIFSNKQVNKYLTVRNDSIGSMAKGLGKDLIHDLKLDKNLYLEYQPQVNKDGIVVGVEALLRWKHEVLGNIPPYIAIIIAQEVDIADELGIWVIDKACQQLQIWKDKGLNDVLMSVNISAMQLKNKNFAANINYIIKKYDITGNDIKLEITENFTISDDNETEKQLEEIEKIGVKLAIDDFGQGYNPILYIQKYKIDIIKLDGSLIKDIVNDEISINIVKSMHSLCETSGITMVAEFVETKEQKEILDELKTCIYQGYLFSKPLDGKRCLEYILEKNSIDKNIMDRMSAVNDEDVFCDIVIY